MAEPYVHQPSLFEIVDFDGIGGDPTVPPPPGSFPFRPDRFGTATVMYWCVYTPLVLDVLIVSDAIRLVLIGNIINVATSRGVPEGIHIHKCAVKTIDNRDVAIASKQEKDALVGQLKGIHINPDGVSIQLVL
jgi:hypothetical protein